MSEIVEGLLLAQARAIGEHSSVELTRNARGEVQIKVSVRTGDAGIETIDDASETAQDIYDLLEAKYIVPLKPPGPAAK